MTCVGHGLIGCAVGLTVLPRSSRWSARLLHLLAFAALANLPDLPLRYWGHDRYEISHSLFVSLVAIGLLSAAILLAQRRGRRLGLALLVAGALAWLSHLLLDSFYNHGQGVAIYWPFSEGRLVLPVPWLEVAKQPLLALGELSLGGQTLRVMGIELLTFGALPALALLLRRALGPATRPGLIDEEEGDEASPPRSAA